MVFSSLIFIFLFLPIVLGVYFLLKKTATRNAFLLTASLLFYAWGEPTYVWVMLVSIVANYFLAIWIEDHPTFKKQILTFAVVFNLGLLAYFKYSNFFSSNVDHLLALFNLPATNMWFVPLPLGVSFFTFHSLSYVIDVFRKQASAQRNLLNMGLYICFFPQLIAGPIVRYHDICGQLTDRKVDADMFSEGITRFIGGLAKKVLIANVIAKPTDLLFGLPPSELSFATSWLAAFLYALQVYFDFSGYSDMAIGLGLMFGFRFLENFNYPYISQSMRELWNRWHISLSNWFRDYLFRPIGGFRRTGKFRMALNLMTVFFFCGLWHGASWHFVAWGVWNGAFLVLERLGLGKLIDSVWRPFRHLYVVAVWLFSMILFRSENMGQAQSLWLNMLGLQHNPQSYYTLPVLLNAEVCITAVIGILACTPIFRDLLYKPVVADRKIDSAQGQALPVDVIRSWLSVSTLKAVPQLMLEAAVMALVVMQLASGAYNPFIYFRF
jgi:alginate O-acetyltransferase complex protein AlgI